MGTQSVSGTSLLPLQTYQMIVLQYNQQGSRSGAHVTLNLHPCENQNLTTASHAPLAVLYLRVKVPSVTNG